MVCVFLCWLSIQAPYAEIKKVMKAASEDPVLGQYVGYTEDQVCVRVCVGVVVHPDSLGVVQ